MADIGALLDAAKLPERTVPLCLRGDLQAEFEDLERQLDAATGDVDAAREIAGRIEALREQMREATVLFRARALPRPDFVALLTRPEHEPHDSNKRDTNLGYHADLFEPALIRACVYDPELSDEQWTVLLTRTLTSGQYGDLLGICQGVNWGEVKVPNSLAASLRLQTYGES